MNPVFRGQQISNTNTEVSKNDLNKIGLFGSMLGHIGDGNFHETILFDGTKERQVVEKCVHDMVHRALEMEGTCTVGTLDTHACFVITNLTLGGARHWARKERISSCGSWRGIASGHEDYQRGLRPVLAHEPREDIRSVSTGVGSINNVLLE